MGNKIRSLRLGAGLTQERVAEMLGGVDQAQVSRWEAGVQGLSATTALALARLLGVSVEGLELETDPAPPANHLAELRRQQGLSLADLAERAGISSRALAQIEYGLQPYADTALRLARELGVGVEDLGLEPDRAQAS